MMRNTLSLLGLCALCWSACQNDAAVQEVRGGGPNSEMVRNPASAGLPADSNQLARITFEQPEFDFGTVNEGTIVEHVFKFTNTGKLPLTILKAKSSCGCTVPEWPEEPIPPGGTGEIRAKFNTDMKTGRQEKRITVTANTYPNDSKVKLMGTVIPVKDKK